MKRIVATLWLVGLLFAALCCFCQFRADSLWPFVIAMTLLVAAWHFRPSLRRACIAIAVVAVIVFTLDVTVFRHRLALECRTWSPVWDYEEIVDILPSPSGRSTAYIVCGGFLDLCYWAYISDGGLFPKHCYIDTNYTDALYPKDFSASWDGAIFAVAGVTYDEASRKISTTKP